MSMSRVKNAAMGVIRSGPIPNPGRHVPTERESNPKEILGIFVNPREDAGETKKARNGMKKKKARSLKRRTTKKRASSATKKRSTSTRRRKPVAKRAARTSNPRRKKRRTAVKRRAVARRATAPKRRKTRRSNPLAPGYMARAANPRHATKRRKKRSSGGKMTVAKMRNLLRGIARRKNPRPQLTGRSGSARSMSIGGAMGAAELKGRGLLDAARRAEMLSAEITSLQEELTAAITGGDNQEISMISSDLAQKRSQLDSLGSGMGVLDAAILTDRTGKLKDLREGLIQSATLRKKEAASRALRAAKRKSGDRKLLEAQAAFIVEHVLTGLTELQGKANMIPALQKEYHELDPVSNVPLKDVVKIGVAAGKYDAPGIQQILLMMPPESVSLAMQMLSRNYIPVSEASAPARAELQIALDRLQALLQGRIENPRGRRRKGRKGRKGSRRRMKNPRGRRKSSKRRKSRKGRKGSRRRNPGGQALLNDLVSGSWGTRLGAIAQIGLGATAGYLSVGLSEKGMDLLGLDQKKMAGWLGASVGAVAHTALGALLPAAALMAVGGWSGPVNKVLWENQVPVLIGIGARVAQSAVDAFVRGSSAPEKFLRASVGLPPTVLAGYGSWSPDMGAYYNFQPVMGSLPVVGYQVAMAGAPKAGYQLSGGVKPGYTVNGYANYAPVMNGYANYAPTMGGRASNPWGNPF